MGPALAGLIYGLAGSSVIFAADAGSFLVSAALLSYARPRAYERAPAERDDERRVSDLRHGLSCPQEAEVAVTERLEHAESWRGAHRLKAILRSCRIESALRACR